jgi:ankyrin repeat protein
VFGGPFKRKRAVPGYAIAVPVRTPQSKNTQTTTTTKATTPLLFMHKSVSLPNRMSTTAKGLVELHIQQQYLHHQQQNGQNRQQKASRQGQQVSPQTTLERIVREKGHLDLKVHSLEDVPMGFFKDLLPEEIDAYDLEVLQAVRESNLDKLKQFHQEGRPLKCSNRFGESLLHLACRKALIHVVEFLVHHAQVPLCVKDDMGRTPLADAFWTIDVNTQLVDLLVSHCPDLLWIADRRGHTPLAYARKEHWSHWNDYLETKGAQGDVLLPKTLLG